MSDPVYVLEFTEAVCEKIGKFVPSPISIEFYEDRLIVHKPHYIYGKRNIRKDVTVMKYADITKIIYKPDGHRIEIYGDGSYTYTKYRADGTLPDTPTKVRNFKGGLTYIDVRFAEVDVIKEIEEHTPFKIMESRGY